MVKVNCMYPFVKENGNTGRERKEGIEHTYKPCQELELLLRTKALAEGVQQGSDITNLPFHLV